MTPLRSCERPYTWASHADGRLVVAWLRRRGADLHGRDESTRKLLQRWAAGGQASVWKVDEVLVRYGYHLSDLPDDAWLSAYCNGRHRIAA